MEYSVYEFFTRDETERDWLISIFGDHQFDGFEETPESLKGYVATERVRDLLVREILYDNGFHHIRFSSAPLDDKNWNEEWEKNFEPVLVADKIGIRAPFHPPFNTELELVIEPKMSFGTGHHATTASMMELMLKLDFKGKSVLDFGSGTGILSILAEKLGAKSVLAIDNEEWAYKNGLENTALNNCTKVSCVLGDESYSFTGPFDVILANINRNIILKNLPAWFKLMHADSFLLLSGILQSDELAIVTAAKSIKLEVIEIKRTNGWLAISFQKIKQKA